MNVEAILSYLLVRVNWINHCNMYGLYDNNNIKHIYLHE